ncbi:MAG: putative sulfate exporter family transporter, partial [Planctomycetota bacterium]
AFLTVFALATLAFVLGGQAFVKSLSLSYPLFAILAGLAISNTVGVPRYLRPALRGELYIKTGLVLYGGELLLAELFALGPPGMAVAWLVTPVVLVATYLFGQKVLGIESKTLNVVVSADMSVCGVSAAIATAAACKAKKEELSLAVGISMLFTAVMMFAIPAVAVGTGMDARWAGAWIGGTIDSSGAVAAAGETLGEEAAAVAITVKLIQNVLIGVIAFAVATYWVTVVESAEGRDRPGLGVVWERFPKFVLGFLGASVVFSLVAAYAPAGEEIVTAATKTTKTLRAWCFCLAFVAIGLETDFRQLRGLLAKGKPLVLYACGQTLNIVLTLAVAYVMFVILFPAS